MDLVDEVHLAVALTELVLGIHEDESALLGNHLTTGKNLAGVVLHDGVVLSRNDALGNDFFLRDVHVVTLVGLGGRSDDGLGETLVLLHAVGQLHTTQLTTAILVLTPGRASEDRADNHLHTETLTLQTHGDHGVGGSQFPVRTDVGSGIQELGSNLVQHLTLEGDALWQYDVESGDAVGGHHHHQVVVDVVHIAYLSVVHALLSIKMEISLC